jgi:RHS repeat-associated protein
MKGLICKFVMAIGLLMASVTASATVTYVYTDPQGTPLAEADASGTITATFDYKPYGSQALGSPKAGPGYTGHVNDPDTGFVYMQARYYDPLQGRFLSVDPLASTAGNTSDFNRYAYAQDNPIHFTDPTGKSCFLNGGGCEIPPATKQLSYDGLKFIERHEGFKSVVYKDSGGLPTIGYGHLIMPGERFSKGVSQSEAEQLLSSDISKAVSAVNDKVFNSTLTQTKTDSLIAFTYNVGSRGLGRSTLLHNVNSGQPVVLKNFTSWDHVGGRAIPGLLNRRVDEYNLYSNGSYGEK